MHTLLNNTLQLTVGPEARREIDKIKSVSVLYRDLKISNNSYYTKFWIFKILKSRFTQKINILKLSSSKNSVLSKETLIFSKNQN